MAKMKQSKTPVFKKSKNGERKKTGPRLSSSIRKQLGIINPSSRNSDDDAEINSDEEDLLHVKDVYEYDEPIPEEDSKKNKRFDQVDNLEYELPEEFEDENLSSDDDDNGETNSRKSNSDQSGEESEGDDGRHERMLQGITGLPAEAFEDKKKKKQKFEVLSETHPESQYAPTREVLSGDSRLGIQDLLGSLHGKRGYSELRKRIDQIGKKSMAVHAPLPKMVQENLERKVAYERSKKDITKWEPLVKRNREATTVFFDEDIDVGYSTVGAIASEFEPRTDFEKKMAALIQDPTIMDAHKEDGARLLELNKLSIEEVKDRHNRLAKMRSLLFRHELKAKKFKKIKSKTYHRLLKKDKMKAKLSQLEMDPEAAKEQAVKQEFKRAEERMTLKHKNSSKWAKRILKRGLDVQDEGTRASMSEQLHQHNLLTRKMNSMKDNTSSDESSDEDDDDELSPSKEDDGASKLLMKAAKKTIKTMEEDDELPTSGVVSLPFMVRGIKRRREEAYTEAKLALEEYESSMKQLEEDSVVPESPKAGTSSGRRVFGAAKNNSEESSKRIKTDNYDRGSDSEDDFKTKEAVDDVAKNGASRKEVRFDSDTFHGEDGIGGEPVFKSFDDIVKNPGTKTTYEVSMFASDSWRKMESNKNLRDADDKKSSKDKMSPKEVERALPHEESKDVDEDDDSESEEMVDGILSTDSKPDYELPSQADLIRLAFAGDDVEEEFEKDKLEVLNEENPEPEKPLLLPGWGQWSHVQKKKGMPSWMREEHENAKKRREDALKKRKDANLKHVIISEKINKKSEKLLTRELPFPYTSKELFEQSIRMPIGPDFNPASTVGVLNRPEVVKKPGVIIKPIEFEDVNPYDKGDDHKKGENQKTRTSRNNKKSKTKGKKNQLL